MTTEKYGGLWFGGTSENGWTVVFEHFDQSLELLGVVRESTGRFRAAIYEKSREPQWRLPVWGERRPDSLFVSKAEAIAYVQSSLSPM